MKDEFGGLIHSFQKLIHQISAFSIHPSAFILPPSAFILYPEPLLTAVVQANSVRIAYPPQPVTITWWQLFGGNVVMDEARDPLGSAANEICAAFRYLGDVSYAILPQQVAHDLGDLKKKILTNVRSYVDSCVDKDIQWIDERVAGGDRLREEWRQACNRNQAGETGEPVS